ncbi:MAG: T9SS type A sorting domain-containing protein [Bacteroidetes bacterium]|nr:T9SS type A sorting domain-containing protein [Bacteroidota bacterium]
MKYKILISILLLLISHTSKSQIILKDIVDRVNDSQYIFEGEVIRSDSYWNEDKDYIYTSVTIQVLKVFKGGISCGTIEMILLGGTVEDVHLEISHNLVLEVGHNGIFIAIDTERPLADPDFYSETNSIVVQPLYNEQGFIKFNHDEINKAVSDYQFSLDSLSYAYDLLELYTQLNYIDCSHSPVHQYNSEQTIRLSNQIHGLSASDTSLVVTLMNQQNTSTPGHNYFEFDICLSDSVSALYFMQSSINFHYDSLTFGSNIKGNGKLTISRGALIQDTSSYLFPTSSDQGNDNFNITILNKNIILFPVNFIDLTETPIPAVHVKIEVEDCNQQSTIEPYINSPFVAKWGSSSQPPINSVVSYDTVYSSNSIGFVGCGAFQIDSISPDTIRAGVGDTLRIFGNGFGATRGTGNVYFPNADNGGANYLYGDTNDFVSWTNTLIELILPSLTKIADTSIAINGNVGTGFIKVKKDTINSTPIIGDYLNVLFGVKNGPINGKKYFLNLTPFDSITLFKGFNFRTDTSVSNHPDILVCVTEAMKQWACLTTVNFKMGADTIYNDTSAMRDNISRIKFGKINDLSTLARTQQWAYYRQGCDEAVIFEADIIINEDLFSAFVYDTTKSNSIPIGKNDFYQVILHELGHAHSLTHVNDPTSVMWWSSTNQGIPASSRRVILSNDNSSLIGGNYIINRSISINPTLCDVEIMESGSTNCTGVGIDEPNNNGESILLYPNPSYANVNLEFSLLKEQEIKLVIYDLSGRIVYVNNIQFPNGRINFAISLENFDSGIYIVKVASKQFEFNKKLIKQ